MSRTIRTERKDRVFTIYIQRPEKKNALTLDMYRAMTQAIHEAESDDLVRVIVIRGTDECFTAGNDLEDFLRTPVEGEESPAVQFMLAVATAKKPLVAAVAGVAVGIGTTMLLHCDLVYAAENARLQMPFVSIGLSPEAGSSHLLPQRLGHQRAAELLYFGQPVDARRAYELGLVNEVFPLESFEAGVNERVARLAAQPPDALRTTKALLKAATADAVRHAIRAELEQFVRLLRGPECKEALEAFLQKRKPDFSKF